MINKNNNKIYKNNNNKMRKYIIGLTIITTVSISFVYVTSYNDKITNVKRIPSKV